MVVMARKKVFQVGDVIRQRQSKDEGRIVRVVDCSQIRPLHGKERRLKGTAYIVSLPANGHTPIKEALWCEDEIAPVECS
jgi:hypothetical protein